MKKIATILTLAAGLAAAPAFAQEGWYRLRSRRRQPRQVRPGPHRPRRRTGRRFRHHLHGARGLPLPPQLAVELCYYDLGKYGFSGNIGDPYVSGSAKAKSWGISAVAIAPMGAFDLYGRLGWEESAAFEAAAAEVLSLPAGTKEGRDGRRKFFGDAHDVGKDGSGRLLIPQPLIKHAGLTKDLVVVGAGEWFEIWDKAAWLSYVGGGAGE